MNIVFTENREQAWKDMLNVGSEEALVDKLQAYLNTIADTHIDSNLESTFKAKTIVEKENLLS